MKTLPLVLAPDPFLKKISQVVDKIDDSLKEFLKQMVQTMYHEGGIGLAGVQVGFLKRVLVMDVDYEISHHHHHDDEEIECKDFEIINPNPQYFINPEIIESSSEKSSFNEGCLSFPGARAEVIRPEAITVKFLDINGQEQVKRYDGISATCIQHEIDHLNGITFVDRISPLKKEVILKKLKKRKNG